MADRGSVSPVKIENQDLPISGHSNLDRQVLADRFCFRRKCTVAVPTVPGGECDRPDPQDRRLRSQQVLVSAQVVLRSWDDLGFEDVASQQGK